MKYVIAGGVAAGAGAAARLRRLDENAEIVLLERGENISYANCGLPYHLGGVIADRDKLLVMPEQKFRAWLNVDVRIRHEVVAIDRKGKSVRVRTPEGEITESYDKLLLATGAIPAGNPFPEKDFPHVMHLWTLADMDRILVRLGGAKKVVIVGAGFIGLETAENLHARGLAVTILQRSARVLPNLDTEMAAPLIDELTGAGIELRFGCTVREFAEKENGVEIRLNGGGSLESDLAIVATGVRPNSALAQEAGLDCGPSGHIRVNEFLQTSDPDIYAAGDVVEVLEPVFGGKTAIPLAGPANKQGRIAADNLAGGRSVYRGSFGASVVKVGRLTAASVGLTERKLLEMKKGYRKIYLHPSSGASYYPGAARLSVKLIFGEDGTIYGAQIVGAKGADKRIDTIAQAMRNGLKAPELGELELAYAPPYSSAKDPVNFAGFIAENVLSGLSEIVYPDTIPGGAQVLDVREPDEYELGAIPGAINIRLGELRNRLNELDKNKAYVTICQVGLRGYLAERILKQNGFKAFNLSGGWLTWRMFHHKLPEIKVESASGDQVFNQPEISPETAGKTPVPETVLDLRSLPCPGPVIKLKAAMNKASVNSAIRVLADTTFEEDLHRWAKFAGCRIENLQKKPYWIEAEIIQSASLQDRKSAAAPSRNHSVAIVLFSNDFDKAMAALILANGLAAAGREVGIFFTFWGLSILRKDPPPFIQKDLISRLFGFMLPRSARKLALSKMNMLGMGSAMMKCVMKRKNVLTIPELIQSAREAGVKFIACEMAMNVMGISREELIDVDEIASVAAFADLAGRSSNTFFI